MAALSFVSSNKNKKQLILNGYLFSLDKKRMMLTIGAVQRGGE
jgi:hypothetical protein